MRKKRLGLFRMAIAFFAGVFSTLFFLVPSKSGPTLLINGDPQSQLQNLSDAGDKIEKIGNTILICAYNAKDFVQQKFEDVN